MTGATKAALMAVPLCLLGVLVAKTLRPEAPPPEPPPPYSISDGRIVFVPGSRLLARLEIVEVGEAAEASAAFSSVGQIIALSNASGSLTGERIGWVELDPRMTASVGLALNGGEAAGTAYGLTALAAEYAGRIGVGEHIEITRYGLKKASVSGQIARVIRGADAGDRVDVVFRFSHGQDWFPGTNCEVAFPTLRGHPVTIPTMSPVHEGTREYVWKELSPGRFSAQAISLVNATPTEASVLGLDPGDRIVGRGAILLKPLLAAVLGRRKS